MQNNNLLILKNTILLYLRLLLSMLVALFTSRIVLNTLGIEDFGIYGVVGGVIALFGFINSSLSSATSRFITYEMGKNNTTNLNKIFNIALGIHVIIALIILILGETVGLWFLTHKLVIPAERMYAAHWVYQLSILSMIIGVTQVPYTATIISHERIDIYAYVDLANIFIRLLIVYLLVFCDYDKLILYSLLMTLMNVFTAVYYRYFCNKHFQESKLNLVWDKNIFYKMFSFSGWDLLGNLSVTVRGQGTNMLINMFFGVAINAASSIASQVQGIVMSFASNILTAVKPQIIKSYASGNYQRSSNLIEYSSVIILYLLLFISTPLIMEMNYILKLWLGIVPQYSVIFCSFTLFFNIFSALAMLILTIPHAAGKNKYPSLFNGILYLTTLPVTYIIFKFNIASVWFPYFYNTVSMIGGCVIIAWIASKYLPPFSLKKFIFNVLLKNFIIIGCIFYLILIIQTIIGEESFMRLIITCITSTILLALAGYTLSINHETRCIINNYITNKIKTIKCKLFQS